MAADEEGQKTIVQPRVQKEVVQHGNNTDSTSGIRGVWIKLMTSTGWYPKDMHDEEKRLILKLDLSILIFGCLSFFTKYLDQQSITNAYVRYVYCTRSMLLIC